MGVFQSIAVFLRAFILGRVAVAVETLALRQQLVVCKQSNKLPKLQPRDQLSWRLLSRLWPNWQYALPSVRPEAVIKWHRLGFEWYARWKSRRGQPGRPRIKRQIRDLIRRMS